MIFTSLKFLLFITVVLAGYFIFPKKARWCWLLAASLYFYLSASIKYAIFLLFSTVVSFIAAILIENIQSNHEARELPKEERKTARKKCDRTKKLIIVIGILLNFGVLFFLKYINFTLENISNIASLFSIEFSPTLLKLVLPVGISFYTFQVTGYMIDVYRGTCEAQRNIFKYALFTSFFPQIMQGPIGRYADLAPQLFTVHCFDWKRVTFGIQRMVFGCFEKLVIADRLAMLVDTVWADYSSYGKLELAFATVCYAIQIYADFAGYMDIAVGCSEVMGIRLSENFDAPYFSLSVPEFWRRWHITLGSWFRDYLFYPVMRSGWCTKLGKLLKKKVGKGVSSKTVTVIALLCVWFFTGLWHGAEWNYIAWGVYYGILIILSTLLHPVFELIVKKLGLNRERPSYKLVQMAKTFCLVCVGYVLFRSTTMKQAYGILGNLVNFNLPYSTPLGMGLDAKDMIVALIAIAVLFVVDIFRYRKKDLRELIAEQGIWLRWIIYFGFIFATIIYGIYGPGYNAASFIYFQY